MNEKGKPRGIRKKRENTRGEKSMSEKDEKRRGGKRQKKRRGGGGRGVLQDEDKRWKT